MPDIPLLLVLIVLMALVFDFTNGAHDCANAIASIVSTKVATPKVAVTMAALLNLCGALLGTEVAKTLGGGLVDPQMLAGCQVLVLAALCGAIFWNLFTWYLGIPSSSSHGLIGALVGAAWAHAGTGAINFGGLMTKVLIPIVACPIIGYCVGFLVMWGMYWLCSCFRRAQVNWAFRRLQYCSAGFMALSHGLNDAQKTMGIITLALFLFGMQTEIDVPLWVKLSCAGAMCLGTALGGWKIVKTMGNKIFKLEPVHGFSCESSTGFVITMASLFGAPVSTTHIISSALFGVGSVRRLRAVNWTVAQQFVIAWTLTLPASGLVGAISYLLLSLIW